LEDLRARLQESWSRALLAASSVEEQAQSLAGRVQHLVEVKGPEAAKELLAEIAGKLQAQRNELKAQTQAAIQTALDRIKLPSRAEVEALQSKLHELEVRVGKIEQGVLAGGGRPSA
jgi:polyhydroxyalkanoate synthesis regulator phasin